MPSRPLGASGSCVSPIIYGAQAFAPGEAAARIRTMHAAIDAGITSIDTAPLYGFGESERLVGRAIRDRRSRVQVLSKVGLGWDDEHGEVLFVAHEAGGARRVVRRDGRPVRVRRDVEQSLRRLGVETLDLCQVHHPDRTVPIEDTMGALLRLRDEGKLRAIGVSNFRAEEIARARRALGDVPLASVQDEYSLLRREVEASVLGALASPRPGLLAYSPLLHGLLAGRGSGRRRLPAADHRRWDPAFAPVNVSRVEAVSRRVMQPMAGRHGVHVAQLALAWVLHQPGVTAVIVGGSTPAQVRANARAAELRLHPQEGARLAAAFEAVELESDPRPRRRDRLRERLERLAARVGLGGSQRSR